jgi:hypothetical protein
MIKKVIGLRDPVVRANLLAYKLGRKFRSKERAVENRLSIVVIICIEFEIFCKVLYQYTYNVQQSVV